MKKILLFSIFVLSILSCAKESPFSIPDAQKSYSFEAAGATQFATVSSTDFTVSCEADWITTQIYKGSSAHNLRITVLKNSKAAERSAEIVLVPDSGEDSEIITIAQKGATPYIKFVSASVSLGIDDKDFTLPVLSNTEFEVATPDWIEYKEEMTEYADSCALHFSTIGEVKLGETRSGYITLTGNGTASETTAKAFVEQIGARWETITIIWGLEDIQYMWNAFGKSTAAITTKTVAAADFTDYPRIAVYDKGGFTYDNASGDRLYVVMSANAQFKINKASSATSKGNVNRDGKNVERMQMSKATSGVGEDCFMFFAPRTGVLEIEAASPTSGDKKPQILVDGEILEETFTAPNDVKPGVTEIPITVESDSEAEVRIFGTAGAINYFQIKYTYERPVLE